MLKNISSLSFVLAEKNYILLCDMDSPLDHVEEIGFQIQKYAKDAKIRAKEESDNLQNPENVVPEEQENVVEELEYEELLTP